MVNKMVAALTGRYIDQFSLPGRFTWMRAAFTLSPPTVMTVPLTETQLAPFLAAQMA
ncbi:MAG: hypothetical protein KDE34_23870 [Anaerolineales bacterium]|nr:hypothetical protein [Anaerolineales bacterium]